MTFTTRATRKNIQAPNMQHKTNPVLVSGATGLIGRELCRQLDAASIPFVAIVRPGADTGALLGALDVVELDLGTRLDVAKLKLPSISAVVHLAQAGNYASFPQGAGEVTAVTIGATVQLAELACALGASRFVFASSGGVYGSGPTRFSEGAELRPGGELGFYLTTKATAEQLLKSFSTHLNVVCLRYFFVFGPHQRKQMLMRRLIESVREGEVIKVPGTRGPELNPIFVTDAARATLRSLHSESSGAINVAGDEVVDLHTVCELIGEVVGRVPTIQSLGGEPRSLVADLAHMHKHLGRPEVSLREGIQQCVNDALTEH
jgi:UDP-glucose 4-epimerase